MNPLDMLGGGDPIGQLIASRTPQLPPELQKFMQGGGGQQPSSPIQPLDPAEESSLLSRLGSGALGALHYVGSTLDKSFGGRAIRGVLGGRPQELASIIPFSDTLGITNEQNRVSGEDLLKKAGVLGERDPKGGWLQARDLAGPAAEIALDPLTYLTFGTSAALTDAGRAAEKAGTLADTAAGRIAAGQSGLVGLGLPFQHPSAVLGTGHLAQTIAGGLDRAGSAALYSYPGRVLSRLFDKNVGNTLSETAQRASRAMNRALPAAEAAARGHYLSIGNPLMQAGALDNATVADQTGQALRSVLEAQASAVPGSAMEVAATRSRQLLDQMHAEANAVGRPVAYTQDYAPRQLTPLETPTRGYGPRGGPDFPLRTGNQQARLDPFKDVPGGTKTLNDMSIDPAVSGPNRTIQNADAHIRHNYLGGSPQDDADLLALRANPPLPTDPAYQRFQQLLARQDQSEQLADIMAGMDPQRAATAANPAGKPLFANNTLSDVGAYALKHAKAQEAAKAIHNMFADSAAVAPASHDTVSAIDALDAAGLRSNTMAQAGGTATGAQATLRDALVQRGLLQPGGDLATVRIPKEVVADAARLNQGFQVPESLRPITGAWDYITNLTKAWQTSFWPANKARDALTGLWQNAVIGAVDPRHSVLSPLAHLQPLLDANTLRQGGVVEGAADIYKHLPGMAGIDDATATNMLRDEMFQWGARGTGGLSEEAVGMGTHEAPGRAIMPNSPDAAEPGLLSQANPMRAVPKSWAEANPLDVRGVAGRAESGNSLVRYGQDLGDAIDDVNRSSAYIAMRRQGYTPEAALQKATAAHYDYENLTPFESQVMRRVVPFYNWCVPDDAQILTRDGWKTCDALTVGDEVLTYSLARDRMEWQPCQAVNVFDHDGDLIEVGNKRRRLRFTPAHRCPVRIRAQRVVRPRGVYHYPESKGLVNAEDLRGYHDLIVAAEFFGQDSLLTPEQARLLGWLVTDGSVRWRGNCVEAVVYQSPKKFLQEVAAAAGGRPRKPHPDTGVVAVPVPQERIEPLKPFLDKDGLTKVVTRLSRPAAEAMYDAMYKADGCTAQGREYDFLAARHPGVRDAFRVLCVLLGKRSHCNAQGVSVSRTQTMHVAHRARVPFKGRVWCPTTANGTWVMMQGGFVTITGNSRQNLPAQLQQLLTKPGGLTGSAIKTAADLGNDQGFTPEYIAEGVHLPVGKEANGQQRYLTELGLPFEDIMDMMGDGPNPAARAGEKFLGETNPLIKGPLELMTGKQFYSDRDLVDLYGPRPTGNQGVDLALDQLMMNSPLQRFYSAEHTMTDPRKDLGTKALNMLTPEKVTDVDLDKARSVAARDMIQEEMRGNPAISHFEQLYVRPEEAATLNPEEMRMMRLYKTLELAAQQKKGRRP